MDHSIPIDIAFAKDQLRAISAAAEQPLLLIGGLAVNQYDPARESQDIDLVCDHAIARQLLSRLYQNHEWTIVDENDDEYRPAFRVQHKFDNFPAIRFGPKIIQRGPYRHLDWEDLAKEARAFHHRNDQLTNIIVPQAEALCYTKLIAFVGRDRKQLLKLKQDLADIASLGNLDEFRLGVFANLIRKNRLNVDFIQEFQDRLKIVDSSQINLGNFGLIAKLLPGNSFGPPALQPLPIANSLTPVSSTAGPHSCTSRNFVQFGVRGDFGPTESLIERATSQIWISGVGLDSIRRMSHDFLQAASRGVAIRLLALQPDEALSLNTATYFGDAEPKLLYDRLRTNLAMIQSELVQRSAAKAELRVLPFRPAMGYFIIDGESNAGYMRVETYTSNPHERNRPMFELTSDSNSRWFDFYKCDFLNLWNHHAKAWDRDHSAS